MFPSVCQWGGCTSWLSTYRPRSGWLQAHNSLSAGCSTTPRAYNTPVRGGLGPSPLPQEGRGLSIALFFPPTRTRRPAGGPRGLFPAPATHVSELGQAALAHLAEALVGRAALQEELRQAQRLPAEQRAHGGARHRERAPGERTRGENEVWGELSGARLCPALPRPSRPGPARLLPGAGPRGD